MIGVLAGVLNGAAFGRDLSQNAAEPGYTANTGQALLVQRPDLFLPLDGFLEAMDRHLAIFRASASVTDEPVRLPGERAAATEAECRQNGIPVPAPLLADLGAMADELELVDRLT
jgi:LDH2 family malate/lactate/ureidoglycolate dehydrogenase